MKENAIITGALIIFGTFMTNPAFASGTTNASGEANRRDRVRTYKSQVIAYSGTSIPNYTGGLFVGLSKAEHKHLKAMTEEERKAFLESKGIVLPETIACDNLTGTTLLPSQSEKFGKIEKQKINKIEKKILRGDTLSQKEKNFAKLHNIKY